MIWYGIIINGCILAVSISLLYLNLTPDQRQYYGTWSMKLTMYFIMFMILVFCMKKVACGIHCFRKNWEHRLGQFLFPLIIACMFSLWLAISPNGSATTMLAGVIWKNNIWVGIIVSYASVNMGAFLTLLWIRCLVIGREKVENNKCVYYIFMFLGIDEIRKLKFIVKLLKAWDPIKILAIFRAPFFTSGVTNYLFAFQPELISAKQYAIGNAIGFIPGSILFCMFGNELARCYDAVSSEKTWNEGIQKHPKEFIIFCTVVVVMVVGCFCAWKYIQNIIKKSEEENRQNDENNSNETENNEEEKKANEDDNANES